MTPNQIIAKYESKYEIKVPEHDKKWIAEMLSEFARQPCTCQGDNYTYGWAKCCDCGRMKPFEVN